MSFSLWAGLASTAANAFFTHKTNKVNAKIQRSSQQFSNKALQLSAAAQENTISMNQVFSQQENITESLAIQTEAQPLRGR